MIVNDKSLVALYYVIIQKIWPPCCASGINVMNPMNCALTRFCCIYDNLVSYSLLGLCLNKESNSRLKPIDLHTHMLKRQ